MAQIHIKNHFVPKLYLKIWENENHEINVYRTLVPHKNAKLWESRSASAIAWQQHLYTKIVALEESDEFEKWFDSEFEDPAKPIIIKAINDEKLTPKDWRILIRFLAAQDLRTPACLLEYLDKEKEIVGALLEKNIKETAEKMQSKEFRDQLILDKEKGVNASSYDELPLKLSFYQDIETRKMRVNAKTYTGRKSWLFLVKGTLENSLDVLTNQKWTIIKPAQGYKFITSDNPVVKLIYSKSGDYELSSAGIWGRPRTTIIFPLSPSHAMITEIGSKIRPIRGTRLSAYRTEEIQNFIANNSHRYIFSQGIYPNIDNLKPRIVDKEFYLQEKNQIEDWHEINKKLEIEYEYQ